MNNNGKSSTCRIVAMAEQMAIMVIRRVGDTVRFRIINFSASRDRRDSPVIIRIHTKIKLRLSFACVRSSDTYITPFNKLCPEYTLRAQN